MIGYISKTLSTFRIDGLSDLARRYIPADRRTLGIVLAVIVVTSLGLAAVIPAVTSASETNLIQNGSFEAPFVYQDGCGTVGSGWNCFTNGGVSNYGFYDDQWEMVVADGEHSQLIEINTTGMAAADNGRFAGLSQTVRVQPHAKYTFSMKGSIRTSELEAEDSYRYSVEVGFVSEPNGHWKDVDNWTDSGWYDYGALDSPMSMAYFDKVILTEDTEVITVFIRVVRKWGTANQELDVNIDNVQLRGPSVGANSQQKPSDGPSAQAIIVNPNPPQGGTGGACVSEDFIFNGDFESGFIQSGYGTVGRGWGAFTNGGAANYGFYDEQWEAVISSSSRSTSSCKSSNPCVSSQGIAAQAIDMGCGYPQPCDCDDDDECAGNGQLIEINTKDKWPADSDRYAGIYQQIGGLTPGAPYSLRLKGLLRGTGDTDDKYRFSAEWGFTEGMDTNWRHVDEWEEMDLGPVYERTEPGGLGYYEMTFRAPSNQIVVFIRGWNKWAYPDVEMDFNLDDISLIGCGSPSSGTGGPTTGQGNNNQGGSQVAVCGHTVGAGESLGIIANKYGADVSDIIQANDIMNADFIYPGQELRIPGCNSMTNQTGPTNSMPIMQPVRPLSIEQDTLEVMDKMADAGRPVPYIQASILPMAGRADDVLAAVAGPTEVSTQIYTVRAGQSLGQIAVENGIDPYSLATANGITNMDFVYVGQQLRIP